MITQRMLGTRSSISIHPWIVVLKDLLGPQIDAEGMPMKTEYELLLKECFSDQL